MKPIIAKTYPYAGDLYSYTISTSADGTVTTRVYSQTPVRTNMSLSVNLLGDLVIESQTKMQINAYLRNIVDRNGNPIYENGVWEIYQTAPLLTGIGTAEGYRYRARLIAGNV